MNLAHDLQYAAELARGAAKIALEHFGRVTRQTKTNSATTDEAVTEADRACQRFIVSGLRKRFGNDDGIIGEESETGETITAEEAQVGKRVWVIDPIDGTNNFIAGLPLFAVCIGLLDAGEPVLGVVHDVGRDLTYVAARGQGAWLGSQRLTAAQSEIGPSSILMMTSNSCDASGRSPQFAVKWFTQTSLKVRVLGTAALEAAQVAAGVAHGAVTVNGKLWDCVAPAAVVLEAGGTVTDLRGKPIFPYDTRRYTGAKVPFLAAGPKAHPTLLKFMLDNP